MRPGSPERLILSRPGRQTGLAGRKSRKVISGKVRARLPIGGMAHIMTWNDFNDCAAVQCGSADQESAEWPRFP